MTTDTLIATIGKNSREEVRVSLTEFKGHRLVDVRTYASFDEGGVRATKKGVSIKVDKLGDLISALQQAAATAKEAA